MTISLTIMRGLVDEFEKLNASKKKMTISQIRKGRRPMRVDTMLRKEREGTLYKHMKLAGKYGKNSAGFDLQGKTEFQGLPIAIENRKGSVRKGKNDDGTEWKTKFKIPYGYIEGTRGADNEEIDAYVGPKKDADTAFVVHQKKKDGKHDEDTVMLGFKSKPEAKKAILQHYDDQKLIGSVSPVPVEELKKRLDTKRKLTKIGTSGSEQSRLEYQETEPGVTGSPAKAKVLKGDVPTREKAAQIDPSKATGKLAKAKPKKGDVPDRESGGGRVKAENRQDITYANIAVDQGEKFHAPEGFSGY